MSDISVIIVNWNAQDFLRKCLQSIRDTGAGAVKEVIVVDNASKDNSVNMVQTEFPEVKLIRSSENLGFAKANNLGIKAATGSLLALVNSDVVVHPECFQKLAGELIRRNDVGLIGPKIFGRDGLLQISCNRLPTFSNTFCQFTLLSRLADRCSMLRGFLMNAKDHENIAEVEVLSGCFWLAKSRAVGQIGGLDERFFFYAEDVDWCKRYKDAGWKVLFLPSATATHFGGGSSSNAPLRYYVEILRANLTYWRKHHGLIGRTAYYLMALLQHSVRLIIRFTAKVLKIGDQTECDARLREHRVCLRWLLTGRGV